MKAVAQSSSAISSGTEAAARPCVNCFTKTVAKCAGCGLAYCAQCYALVQRCPQCAPRPAPRPLVSAEYADSDEEVANKSHQELVNVGGHSNDVLVPVVAWSPSSTEQLWLDFISKSTPGLAQDVMGFFCVRRWNVWVSSGLGIFNPYKPHSWRRLGHSGRR